MHVGLSGFGSLPQMAMNENFNKYVSSLENAFSRRDFSEIIESPELFWLAFCKAFSQIDGEDSDCFATSLKGKTLTISGKEHIILDLQKCVEQIRKLFARGMQERTSFTILPVKISTKIFIRDNAEFIDLTDWLNDRNFNLYETWFGSFVEPTMQSFCELIGVTCSDVVVPIRYKCVEEQGVLSEDVKAFKIDWVSGDHFVYPIEAKVIPSRNDLKKSMHSMYENQILCDLSLVAKDGAVNVHSIPLFTYGGEMIQKMLTCNMKESLEKVVYFNEFSLNSVKAFVDFMYLGEDGLEPESVLKRDVDLCELFHMAHTYQVQTLIDCCTNLFSLFSSTKDIEKIKYLAELYENEHLKKLHEYLLLKLNPSQTGFIKI